MSHSNPSLKPFESIWHFFFPMKFSFSNKFLSQRPHHQVRLPPIYPLTYISAGDHPRAFTCLFFRQRLSCLQVPHATCEGTYVHCQPAAFSIMVVPPCPTSLSTLFLISSPRYVVLRPFLWCFSGLVTFLHSNFFGNLLSSSERSL